MTANTIDQVPEPLRTRCRVIHVPKVSQAQLIQFAERQAVKLCLTPPAAEAVLLAMEQVANNGRQMSLRDIIRMLERAETMQGRPRLQ